MHGTFQITRDARARAPESLGKRCRLHRRASLSPPSHTMSKAKAKALLVKLATPATSSSPSLPSTPLAFASSKTKPKVTMASKVKTRAILRNIAASKVISSLPTTLNGKVASDAVVAPPPVTISNTSDYLRASQGPRPAQFISIIPHISPFPTIALGVANFPKAVPVVDVDSDLVPPVALCGFTATPEVLPAVSSDVKSSLLATLAVTLAPKVRPIKTSRTGANLDHLYEPKPSVQTLLVSFTGSQIVLNNDRFLIRTPSAILRLVITDGGYRPGSRGQDSAAEIGVAWGFEPHHQISQAVDTSLDCDLKRTSHRAELIAIREGIKAVASDMWSSARPAPPEQTLVVATDCSSAVSALSAALPKDTVCL